MPRVLLYILVLFITLCRGLALATPLIQSSWNTAAVEWYDQDGSEENSEVEKVKYETKEDNWFAQIELPEHDLLSLKFIPVPYSRLLENTLQLFCPPPNKA